MTSLLCIACGNSEAITPKTLPEDEKACYQFVKNKMLSDGGMMTNFHEKPRNEALAAGSEVLSESQGLLLNYTADIADRTTFDEVYNFTREHLDDGSIIAYRYDPDSVDGDQFRVNAAVDDLRIMKALFHAGSVFSDKILIKEAESYADRFYSTNVEKDNLYDFYDTEHFMKNDFITLCYLDLEAIGVIAEADKRYSPVYHNALKILEDGYISQEFPMFMTRYNYTASRYEAPNGVNMVEAVLTALNLSYAGKCPDTTVSFLKQQLDKGQLYARYEVDGTVKEQFESTAIYALCALLAIEISDEQMYEKSMELMKGFMVTQEGNPLYGAFGDGQNVYSFDNLMALTAFRKGVMS